MKHQLLALNDGLRKDNVQGSNWKGQQEVTSEHVNKPLGEWIKHLFNGHTTNVQTSIGSRKSFEACSLVKHRPEVQKGVHGHHSMEMQPVCGDLYFGGIYSDFLMRLLDRKWREISQWDAGGKGVLTLPYSIQKYNKFWQSYLKPYQSIVSVVRCLLLVCTLESYQHFSQESHWTFMLLMGFVWNIFRSVDDITGFDVIFL